MLHLKHFEFQHFIIRLNIVPIIAILNLCGSCEKWEFINNFNCCLAVLKNRCLY